MLTNGFLRAPTDLFRHQGRIRENEVLGLNPKYKKGQNACVPALVGWWVGWRPFCHDEHARGDEQRVRVRVARPERSRQRELLGGPGLQPQDRVTPSASRPASPHTASTPSAATGGRERGCSQLLPWRVPVARQGARNDADEGGDTRLAPAMWDIFTPSHTRRR